MMKYYHAYEERYKTVHKLGLAWASDVCSPIVMETIRKYGITPTHDLLELGCGEGRDAKVVLNHGYPLVATDISQEVIAYCRKQMPDFEKNFSVLDCVSQKLDAKFDFIYSIAVIHMLVEDEDRDGFYRFLYQHLKDDAVALICTMGDGKTEMQSDISKAFTLQERDHPSGKVLVTGTSCRMVSFDTWKTELTRNGLTILETGITSSPPEFDRLMYAVVQRNGKVMGLQ